MAWRGFYKFSELDHWGDLESRLHGRPNRLTTPGVEMTVGLPGHGLSVAVGLALSAKLKKSAQRVFTLLGDGECQSGLVWEGAEVAAKHHLSNLVVIIDKNRIQADGVLKEVMPLDPLADKWRAFNWHVLEIDGHSTAELMEAFDVSKNLNDDPIVIIAHTTKGKGVAFMENNPLWHSKIPDDQQLALALHDLDRGQIK
jgi:transketolase